MWSEILDPPRVEYQSRSLDFAKTKYNLSREIWTSHVGECASGRLAYRLALEILGVRQPVKTRKF